MLTCSLQKCDCVSWSIISGCLSGPLKCSIVLHTSREGFVYWRRLHILRHASLLIKRHYICPYLLCTVNQWAENSSQESVFAVACHGKWARILDAPRNWEPAYHTTCQTFFLLVNWRPSQTKCKNLFHKRQKMLSKIPQGDPTWCRYLKKLFHVHWISSKLRLVYIFLPSL